MKSLEICKKLVAWVYLFFTVLILVDVLIFQNFINQFSKKEFSINNALLLLIGAALIAAVGFLVLRYYNKIHSFLEFAVTKKLILILALVGLILQLYVSYNIYFLTGWDAEIILDTAKAVAAGESVDSWYYKTNPNNLFTTLFYAEILKINASVGIFTENGGVFSIIFVQCIFSAAVSYLVYSITYGFTKSKLAALFAFLTYAVLVGLSPWFVIPYTDATGIIFPVLIFRVYQYAKAATDKKWRLTLWGLLGLLCFIGFKFKPHIAIIFIAILAVEICTVLFSELKDKKKLISSAASLAVCLALFLGLSLSFSVYQNNQDKIAIDPDGELGMAHFFMMGLNDETDGIYSYDDVEFSRSFETKSERSKANLEKAKERLSEFGVSGLIRHITEKSLVNFGDGTFAWSAEGSFFKYTFEPVNSKISPFLRSFYYTSGERYSLFCDSMQIIWLSVLTLSAISVLYVFKKRDRNAAFSVLLLSLIGLTVFETLFEARARYLFTYSPIYIICAAVGLYSLFSTLKNRIEK